MKPMGTIPYFLAALRRRVRARSLAASSSKATWLKRAKALRTCDLSLIGRRFRPRESTYAKALLGNRARFFELSWPMAEIPFRRRANARSASPEWSAPGSRRRYPTRRHGATCRGELQDDPCAARRDLGGTHASHYRGDLGGPAPTRRDFGRTVASHTRRGGSR